MSKVAELIKQKRFPYVTVGLIAVNVVWFIVVALGGNTGMSSYMLSRGADFAPYVFEQQEYWRLLTSMFLHFSFRHLAGNMVYLGIVGGTYEHVVGHWRFLVLYMLSGLGGSVVSCAYHQLTHQPVVSAGASGAVYGLIAMVIYLTYIARRRSGTGRLMYRLVILVIFMFYSNFAGGQGIDVAAHVGGLLFGFLLCLILLPYKKRWD